MSNNCQKNKRSREQVENSPYHDNKQSAVPVRREIPEDAVMDFRYELFACQSMKFSLNSMDMGIPVTAAAPTSRAAGLWVLKYHEYVIPITIIKSA